MLSPCCCKGFSGCTSRGYSLVAVSRFPIARVSFVGDHRLYGTWTSTVAAHGLSRYGSQALEQRLNSCRTRA